MTLNRWVRYHLWGSGTVVRIHTPCRFWGREGAVQTSPRSLSGSFCSNWGGRNIQMHHMAAMTGTRTVTKQGRGRQGHSRPLQCRDLSTEQRPRRSNSPDRGGNGTGPQGSCPSMSEDRREARVASGQATGRVAEVQGGTCGAVGFLLHEMGTHSGFGGVERDPP